MNTPAHLIFGAAAFGRPGAPAVTAAALAGALAPDLSLYLMAGWALYVAQVPAQVVFDEMYFSPAWQRIFAVDNSFILWGLLFVLSLARGGAALRAFAAAGLLHLAFDFPLHNDDARRHFWPLSDWVFASPLSYWDRRHYGDMVGAAEIAACVILTGLLVSRFRALAARLGLVALLALELGATGVWALIF